VSFLFIKRRHGGGSLKNIVIGNHEEENFILPEFDWLALGL
jgi:hypothetical protein